MGTVTVVRAFSDATMLATFGVRYLPHYMVASTVAFVAVSALYGAAVRRVPAAVRDAVVVGALALLAAGAPWATRRGGPALFAVLSLLVAVSSLVNLVAWNAVASTVAGRAARAFLPRAG